MKLDYAKNAGRSIACGWLLKGYQIIVPFLMRTVMIHSLGAEYLGLGSLFTSLLQVLNLAELGVGSAMVYSMYRPIAEEDAGTICALLQLYRQYYRGIGYLIAGIGLALMPFLPRLIRGEIPAGINLYVLYLMNLASTVLSYRFFAYRGSILQAHQRTDVMSRVGLLASTVQYALQFVVVIGLRNYYLYVLCSLLAQMLNNALTARAAGRMYPEYTPQGELPQQAIGDLHRRIRDLFTARLGGVIVHSADSIVVSAFLGLTALAVYQNYYYILTSATGFIGIIYTSCMAGIGNRLLTESGEQHYQDLIRLTDRTQKLAGLCSTCLLCLYQPFMKLWAGEELMLGMPAVVSLCVYCYVYVIHLMLNMWKDAAGIWHEDRFRPLITAAVNLVMNLLTVQTWGICGVLLSTVFSTLLIGMPWLIRNLFTHVFRKEWMRDYIRVLGCGAVRSGVCCVITCAACFLVQGGAWETLMVHAVICCGPAVLLLLIRGKGPSQPDIRRERHDVYCAGEANSRHDASTIHRQGAFEQPDGREGGETGEDKGRSLSPGMGADLPRGGRSGGPAPVLACIIAAGILGAVAGGVYLVLHHYHGLLNYQTTEEWETQRADGTYGQTEDSAAGEADWEDANIEDVDMEDDDTEEGMEIMTQKEVSALMERMKAGRETVEAAGEGLFHILLIGVDARENSNSGRSDCMMLISMDEEGRRIVMTSFLRDIWVSIPGHGYDRLNAAYVYGGPGLLEDVLAESFGITVDRYMTVNFYSVMEFIDAVGGVDIEVTAAEIEVMNEYITAHNKWLGKETGTDLLAASDAGELHLNGSQTLAYAQVRYIGTDFARTGRQRLILEEVLEKCSEMTISELAGLCEEFLPRVTTDLSEGDLARLVLTLPEIPSCSMEQMTIPAEGTWYYANIENRSVLVVDLTENSRRLSEALE